MKKRRFNTYRRSNKTNYRKRLTLLKSGITRLVVRTSDKNIYAQLIEYDSKGDKVLFALSSKEITKKGWKGSGNCLPASYLVGYALGKKASLKVKNAVLDIGKRRSVLHSRIYALVKGIIDGGINVNADQKVFPSEERIKGNHIKKYAEQLAKEDKTKYAKIFSQYLKNKQKPEELPKHFEEIKSKL